MGANARRHVDQAARAVLVDAKRIAPQITGYRVINPFAADNVFVVYYVLATRQQFQAAVDIGVLTTLQQLMTSQLAQHSARIEVMVELVEQEDVRDIDNLPS
jgi:hypothetical protein